MIDVIALSPTSPSSSLSYRSREKLKEGTIVVVSLRRTDVHGIVVGCREVRDAKAELKTADFALAKSVRRTDGTLAAPLLRAAERIALYHAAPLGSVLHALLSDAIATDLPRVVSDGEGFERSACEFPVRERLRKYRSLIERAEGATLLVLPTIAELSYAKEYFMDEKPLVLSGSVKPEQRAALLNEAADTAGLVLATPAYSFVAMKKLKRIIVERPSAGTYRMPRRPHLDRVAALLLLAEERGIPVTLGDYPLPLEYRDRPEDPLRNTPTGEVEAVDVREAFAQGEAWKSIPDRTLMEIRAALADRKRVLILAARKGYAPSVVCRDCGTALKDERGLSYSLVTSGEKRVLRTADGKSVASAEVVCPNCGSWNLMPLGIGVERVVEDMQAAFPEEMILRFDADTAKTDAQARKVMKAFRESPGILVATETVLPWLPHGLPKDEELDLAIIASMDSLLALPFWRARERFVRIGLLVREYALRTLVQTRAPEDAALSAVLDPKATEFFAEEDMLRKALSYPPYSALIAITAQGSERRLEEAQTLLTNAVAPRVLTYLPRKKLLKGGYTQTALVQIARTEWPEETLARALQALPPYLRVMVDPETF